MTSRGETVQTAIPYRRLILIGEKPDDSAIEFHRTREYPGQFLVIVLRPHLIQTDLCQFRMEFASAGGIDLGIYAQHNGLIGKRISKRENSAPRHW